jgi:hypothetical protein
MALHKKELAVLQRFVSSDKTRPHLNTVWKYESAVGISHMATNGHVLILRRTGGLKSLSLADLDNIPAEPLNPDVYDDPPRIGQLLVPPRTEGKQVDEVRGIDPAYVGMVAEVEKVVGSQQIADYVPPPGLTGSAVKLKKATLRLACAKWTIGCDAMDPWYWRIQNEMDGTLWEGIIMPRRV